MLATIDFEKVRTALKTNGAYIIEGMYSELFCKESMDVIDQYKIPEAEESMPLVNYEMKYDGSELRIWKAYDQSSLFQQFYDDANYIYSQVLGKKKDAFNLLAIKNEPLNKEALSLTTGRWHLDSFVSQIKIFLFLSDTTEESGPLAYIPTSQQLGFKLKMLFKGEKMKLKDIFSKTSSYQVLDDAFISRLSEDGFNSTSILCKKGTIAIVDSSAIHRACPCIKESRYALVSYF